MNLSEPKLPSWLIDKQIPLHRCQYDVKLIQIQWQCPQCKQLDLFEKLIESSQLTDQAKVTEHQHQHPHPHDCSHRQGCKCSKIGCLKLYCECFAKGLMCGPECICSGCENCTGNESKIQLAQQMANFRKPGAFKGVKAYVPERKCTCKKSQCLKNYCECHNAGLKCTPSCSCTDCHNKEPTEYYLKEEPFMMEIEVEG